MTRYGMRSLFLLIALVLSACSSSIDITRYENTAPTFELVDFFDGKVKAWGIVQNRSGEVIQRFTVDILGSTETQGNEIVLVLDETFDYEVGEGVTSRVWRIRPKADNQYLGEASDIANTAIGNVYGNALRWQYEMDLTVDESQYRVKFDDWMWMFADGTLINRSYIKKFGLTFAEVTLFMQKQN